jgi:hypothetical protein
MRVEGMPALINMLRTASPRASDRRRGVADQTITYTLDAHAPGSPEDQSTPRRLSLARGLAVRSILINAGIPSTRIYVHALGTIRLGKTEPDRVDVTLTTIGGAPRAKPKPATP